MQTIKELLEEIIRENDGSQSAAAEKIGISKSYLSQILKEGKKPSNGVQQLIIQAHSQIGIEPVQQSNVRPAPPQANLRRVPVVSLAQCGTIASDYQDICNQIDETVPTDSKDPNSFAIYLVGDSMESYASAGDTVILNPNTPPRYGQPALVRLKSGETLFKWYFPTGLHGEKVYLCSENREYENLVCHAETIEWAYSVHQLIRQAQTRRLQDFVSLKPTSRLDAPSEDQSDPSQN